MIAHFDGDDVGPALELLLIDEKLEEARAYSTGVSGALQALVNSLQRFPLVDVIVQGGDDLVIEFPDGALSVDTIEQLRVEFTRNCQRTMSVGIGRTARAATHALHRAKLLGKDRIVTDYEGVA